MLPPQRFQDELMYDFIAVASQTIKVIDVRALKISLIIQPCGIIVYYTIGYEGFAYVPSPSPFPRYPHPLALSFFPVVLLCAGFTI